ncbi:MAG: hypothetical protein IT470_06160 [Pseudomonadales bacterium]|nr:hypothetical protein [Pseudomonadales bacterium]
MHKATAKTAVYAYDAYSRVSRKTWPSGFAVTYGYNANGYANTVKDAVNDAVYWQATAMDPCVQT